MTKLRAAASALAAAALAGCQLAPAYKVPPTPAPLAFKENGPWTQATPADAVPKGAWWSVLRDPLLDRYESRLETANPTVAEAAARYDTARALAAEASALQLPTLGMSAQFSRNRQSDNRPLRGAHQPNQYSADTVGGGALWELDFWGRLRDQAAAGRAEAQASAADLQSIRLGLEAELADDYIRLRSLDAETQLLTDTVKAYAKALQIVQDRYDVGVMNSTDVDRAKTQLESARAAVSDVASQRALYEHAIASLIGEPASNVTVPAGTLALRVPNIPTGLPSTLLQRRPDVAAAERRAFEANEEIGVAKAAFFPQIDLAAQGGWQNTAISNLFAPGNTFWMLGPQMAFTLFDGGLRHARVQAREAQLREANAAYRAQVLRAFQEVEDNLAILNHLAVEADDASAAISSATRAQSTALARYEEGATNYLDVVTAQTAALEAQRLGIEVQARRLQASVGLVRAIGGGWSVQDLPGPTQVAALGPASDASGHVNPVAASPREPRASAGSASR